MSERWRHNLDECGAQGFVHRILLALNFQYMLLTTSGLSSCYLNDNYRWFNHMGNCASLRMPHLRGSLCK
jgi:hypothetical protein